MAVVRGALGPLLEKTIKEQLAYEHQVLEDGKERVPVSVNTLDSIGLVAKSMITGNILISDCG